MQSVLCSKYVNINKILYVSNKKRSMSIESIPLMSHMLAPYLIELHTLRVPKKYTSPIISAKICIATLNVGMIWKKKW